MNDHSSQPLLARIFSSSTAKRFVAGYRRVFSIHEVEESSILRYGFGLLLLSHFVMFFGLVDERTTSISSYLSGHYSCWSYFQDCGRWFFLQSLPYGYSQEIFYAGILALVVITGYFITRKEWVLAHMGLAVLWLWKFLVIYVISNAHMGNYDKYDIYLGMALLFFARKLFFVRLTFVTLYFCASTIKIHEGWILGTYFTSLATGMPIFPDAIVPFMTNLVIFMQIVGCWFLLSENKKLQRAAFVYFICFHMYSSILVAYRYLVSALPPLLLYFGHDFKAEKPPLDKKSIAGWLLIGFLFLSQSIGLMIPGDQKLTLEGNFYGLYMFEANHQCISQTVIYFADGTSASGKQEHAVPRYRCDPYQTWFVLHQACERSAKPISSIRWTFDHSINGGPFYRIVDVEDACRLEYHPFSHNQWIKTEFDHPAISGYPVKNFY